MRGSHWKKNWTIPIPERCKVTLVCFSDNNGPLSMPWSVNHAPRFLFWSTLTPVKLVSKICMQTPRGDTAESFRKIMQTKNEFVSRELIGWQRSTDFRATNQSAQLTETCRHWKTMSMATNRYLSKEILDGFDKYKVMHVQHTMFNWWQLTSI